MELCDDPHCENDCGQVHEWERTAERERIDEAARHAVDLAVAAGQTRPDEVARYVTGCLFDQWGASLTPYAVVAADLAPMLGLHRDDGWGNCVTCRDWAGLPTRWPCRTARALPPGLRPEAVDEPESLRARADADLQ